MAAFCKSAIGDHAFSAASGPAFPTLSLACVFFPRIRTSGIVAGAWLTEETLAVTHEWPEPRRTAPHLLDLVRFRAATPGHAQPLLCAHRLQLCPLVHSLQCASASCASLGSDVEWVLFCLAQASICLAPDCQPRSGFSGRLVPR